MVTIEAESLPTVARITVRNGDISMSEDMSYDALDDQGIPGVVAVVAQLLAEVQGETNQPA